jgi:hypothetical protein
VAEIVGELLKLTRDQKSFYAENGFLSVESVTSVQEVRRVRSIIERLMVERAGVGRGDRLDVVGDDDPAAEEKSPQLLMPCNYARELIGRLHEDARQLARQLLGDDLVSEGEHVIMKPPCGPGTPLHQDEAFWSPQTDYCSLSIWFPLADVREESGCMMFVPGSHKHGIVPHRSINGDRRNNGIEVCEGDSFSTVPIPLMAGAATIHHCRTIHGATPNRSSQPRYAYILGFGLPHERSSDVRNFYWQEGRELRREILAQAGGYELTRMHPEL